MLPVRWLSFISSSLSLNTSTFAIDFSTVEFVTHLEQCRMTFEKKHKLVNQSSDNYSLFTQCLPSACEEIHALLLTALLRWLLKWVRKKMTKNKVVCFTRPPLCLFFSFFFASTCSSLAVHPFCPWSVFVHASFLLSLVYILLNFILLYFYRKSNCNFSWYSWTYEYFHVFSCFFFFFFFSKPRCVRHSMHRFLSLFFSLYLRSLTWGLTNITQCKLVNVRGKEKKKWQTGDAMQIHLIYWLNQVEWCE